MAGPMGGFAQIATKIYAKTKSDQDLIDKLQQSQILDERLKILDNALAEKGLDLKNFVEQWQRHKTENSPSCALSQKWRSKGNEFYKVYYIVALL